MNDPFGCRKDSFELISTSGNCADEAKLIEESKANIVFLDIHLGDKARLQLLQELGKTDFQLIFVTAYQNYALEAFRFSAIDYLLIPVDTDELVHTVEKAIDSANQRVLKAQINALVHNLS